jgi:hypothetical protein
MAQGLVLREVPLLCGDKRSACAARSYPAFPLLRGDKAGTSAGSGGWFPCCSPAMRGQGGDKPPALRGQAPRWSEGTKGRTHRWPINQDQAWLQSLTPAPIFLLSEAQVQPAFLTGIPDAGAGFVQLSPLLRGDKRRAWSETHSRLWVE